MFGKIHLLLSGMMLLILSATSSAAEMNGKALVNDYCTACHVATEGGGLARISAVRKTPEGWDMTIFRMQHVHGLQIDADERADIVKYLSDEYGLAPAEAAPFRYVLEQRPHFVDKAVNDDLDALCGRCHTNARYGLQRRTEQDWLKHMHFHIGQFPSIEYQARSRDRYWWREVTTETYKELAALYPLQTATWSRWKAAVHPSPEGKWRVSGHRPGVGDYEGLMTVKKDGDFFAVDYDLRDMAGDPITGDSRVVIYTGYEWRGSGMLDGAQTREIFALSEDGAEIRGRWHEAAHYDIGGEFHAVRVADAAPRVLGQSTTYIRRGESRDITFHGVALDGAVSADPELDVRVRTQDALSVTLRVAAPRSSAPGRYGIRIGAAKAEITLYDRVDAVRVLPESTIARVGGGKTPPVSAQFEAVAYMNGADGVPGTDDDVRIGIMAADWRAMPFDAEAAHLEDVKFAGRLTDRGRFLPASAGPNPRRKYATNNAGNLIIQARVKDGERTVTGEARLIVTVQRWNRPPIR